MSRRAAGRKPAVFRAPVATALVAVVAALGLYLGLTATAPRNALTVVRTGQQARAVSPGARYFRPPGVRVVSEPASGTVQFPDDAGYRLLSGDGAEIPAEFTVRYTLQDPGPLLEFLRAQPDAPASSFARDVIGGALRESARRAAAGIDAAVIYQTRGRALVEAITREVRLPRGVQVDITLDALAMSATAQRSLVTGSAKVGSRRILFIGIEGLDPLLLDPLLIEGRMPNLARLIRAGVRADLKPLAPIVTPLNWTSLATGVGPDRHGIVDFVVQAPGTGHPGPATSSARRVPAIWNIATNYGRSVNVVGWPATWPAERIQGTVVSDRFGFAFHSAGRALAERVEGAISPPAFEAGARKLTFDPDELTFEKVTRFLDISRAELAAAKNGGTHRSDLVHHFLRAWAAAETSRRIGVELVREKADLTAVCFDFVDAMEHDFMPYAPPRRPGISVADFDRYRDAVKLAYVEMDRMAGTLLGAAGDSTVVVIVSDHGFLSGSRRPGGPAAPENSPTSSGHREPGLLILTGPGIRTGARLAPVHVVDVAPTLLHLAGLPVSEELPGQVLTGAFTVAGLTAHPVRRIDRYRLSSEIWAPPAGPVADRSPDADRPGAAAIDTTAGAWIELGIGRLRQDEAVGAVDAFDRALALEPGNVRALVNRGHARFHLQHSAEAELDFRKALALAPNEANAHFGLGLLAAERRNYDLARSEFRRTLELDPLHESARENLDRLRGSN